MVADALHAADHRPVHHGRQRARATGRPRHAGRTGGARRPGRRDRSGDGASSCWWTWSATRSRSIRCSPGACSSPRRAWPCPAKTAVVLAFGPRAAWSEGRGAVDPWRRAGSSRTPAPGRGPLQGPDPDGQGLPAAGRAWTDPSPGSARRSRARMPTIPALTLDIWRDRIRRHPGELKNLLRNQSFVAGIGNAYSDEILHAAGLLPFRKRSSLAAEEVDALYPATRETLASAIDDPARTGPADVREAGPRLPRRPRQGRSGVPALRDADHRGQGRRLHHVLLPGLPALAGGQGKPVRKLEDRPDPQRRRVLDVVQLREHLPGRAIDGRDAAQGVAWPHLVGASAAVDGAGVFSVGTRVSCGRRARLARATRTARPRPRRRAAMARVDGRAAGRTGRTARDAGRSCSGARPRCP